MTKSYEEQLETRIEQLEKKLDENNVFLKEAIHGTYIRFFMSVYINKNGEEALYENREEAFHWSAYKKETAIKNILEIVKRKNVMVESILTNEICNTIKRELIDKDKFTVEIIIDENTNIVVPLLWTSVEGGPVSRVVIKVFTIEGDVSSNVR